MNSFYAGSVKKAPQSRGMSGMLRRLAARRMTRALTTSALLAVGAHSALAQGAITGDTIYRLTGAGNFSSVLPAAGDPNGELIFTGGAYTATDDLSAASLNNLTFNGSGLVTVIPGTAGNVLTLTANGNATPIAPSIYVGPSGAVINTILGGAAGFIKVGSGTLTLNNAETYTGATSLNSGILALDFTATGAPATNILAPTSTLSLHGGTLNVLGNAAGGTSQTFGSSALLSGASVVNVVTGGGANPTIALGAITFGNPSTGGTIQFNGPSTSTGISSGTGQTGAAGNATTTGAVASTATITTTTTANGANGTTAGGVLISPGVTTGGVALYGTVGLYDFAALSSGTVIGLSQSTGGSAGDGGYNITSGTMSQTLVNDLVANTTFNTGGKVNGIGVRFNTNSALTFTSNAGQALFLGGVLVTPNVGAFNSTLASTSSTKFFAPGAFNILGAGGSMDIYQNDTLGFLNFTGTLGTGNNGTAPNGAIVQSGLGTVVYSGTSNYLASGGFPFNGTFYLNGGVSEISTDGGFGSRVAGTSVNLNGGTIMATATFTLDNAGVNLRQVILGDNGGGIGALAGNTLTVDGVVSGTGPLTIGVPASTANGNVVGLIAGTGAGTANTTAQNATGIVVLTNTANTFTGAVNVVSGSLLLGPSANITSTQPVTIANGATFGTKFGATGSASVAGAVTDNNGGTLALQDGKTSTLNLNGGLTFAAGSIVNFDIGGGATSDNINLGATGVLNVAGTTTINLSSLGTISSGQQINLFTFTGGNATGLGNFVLGTQPTGFTYTLGNNNTNEFLNVMGNPVPANAYWTGSQGTSTWNTLTGGTLTNFSSDPPGMTNTNQLPGAITNVFFTATTPANVNTTTLNTTLGQDFSINSLDFNSSDQTATTVGGANTLTIGAGGLTVDSGDGASPTISTTGNVGAGTAGVVIGANEPWANNSANPLTVTGSVGGSAAGGGTTTLTFAGAGPGNTILSGVVGNGANGGNLNITVNKTGGTLVLGGANTFSGGLTLVAGPTGVATVQAATGAPAGVFGSGTVTLANNTQLDMNGDSITTGLLATSGTGAGASITSSVAATSDTITLAGSGAATFAGVISNPTAATTATTSLTLSGPVAQTLTGANTYTGLTLVTNGALTIGTGGSITSQLNIAAEVAAASVTVNGGSVGTSTAPTGTLFLASNSGGGGGFGNAATLTVQNSGSVYTTGFSLGDGVDRPPAGNTFNLGTAGSATDASVFSDTGTFQLFTGASPNSAGSGTFNLNSGTLTVGSFVKATGGATTTDVIHLNGATVQPTASDASAATFLPALASTTVNVDTGGAKFNDNGNAVTIAANLLHGTGTPDGGLAYTGTGTLTLTGNNTYNGGTRDNTGALVAGADNALGTGNVRVVNSGTSGATLTLQGGTNNTYISSLASLILNSGNASGTNADTAFINLNFTGTDTIAGLSFDGGNTLITTGVYGGVGSGATNINSDFTGAGTLTIVAAAPEPSQFVAFGLGILGLGGLTLRARKRAARMAS